MSDNYNRGLDLLSRKILSVIQAGIDNANRSHQPPYDYATLVKKEIEAGMTLLQVTIPALLYNTGLAKTYSSDTNFSFGVDVKSVSYRTSKSNPLLTYPFVSADGKTYTVLYKYIIGNVDLKLDDSANNFIRRQELKERSSDHSLNFGATRDLSPITTYNSALRLRYIKEAKKLYPLYDNGWKENISNRRGVRSRYALKEQTRRLSIAGGGRMLDLIEPMDKKPLINPKTGNVTRFWYTRPSMNNLSRGTAALGVVGLGLTVARIANANDKIRESQLVAGGLAGGWAMMSAGAPLAASAGVAVTPFLSPIGGIIVGGIIEFGFGAVGAIGGEWLTEEAIRLVDR